MYSVSCLYKSLPCLVKTIHLSTCYRLLLLPRRQNLFNLSEKTSSKSHKKTFFLVQLYQMMFWWFQLCQWWCIAVVVLEGKGENRNYLYLSDTSSSDVRISMESNPRSADGQTRIRIRPESDQTQNCVIGSFHWKPARAEDE